MTEGSNKQSRVEFERIEVGVLGNCRSTLNGITELAADINERGLLQPLIVWHKHLRREPHTLPDGRQVWDRYILIAGNRRHAALARIREDDRSAFANVPVTLFVGNEADALFAQLAENIQREDLNPVDLANAIFRLRQRDHTQAVIARRLGKSQGQISKLLRLREQASEPVLRALAKGEITTDTALAVSELDEGKQAAALDRYRGDRERVGRAEAGRNARRNAGQVTRPSVAEIRSRQAFFVEHTARSANDPRLQLANALLAWVLGQGDWPKGLPLPKEEAA